MQRKDRETKETAIRKKKLAFVCIWEHQRHFYLAEYDNYIIGTLIQQFLISGRDKVLKA